MTVFDLFSKRQKRSRGEVPDVYQYETIPTELRVQIVHIIRDAFGDSGKALNGYKFIHETLCREYGVFSLGEQYDSDFEAVVNFFLQTEEVDKSIDFVELTFKVIDSMVRKYQHLYTNCKQSPDEAIAELNHRFREHGVGYQYESGMMIRVDDQFIHEEIIRPALSMLSNPMYEGANAEFLSAHEHYREGKYKECLNDCLKAFESTIKAICTQREWEFSSDDTASRLIKIVFDHELIPSFMQTHFGGLRSTLEAGVPTVRNRLSGHGQGTEEVIVPESVAAYALHLTASNVLLLTRANAEMR
ncbi:MAG TPA: hypothetical protein PLK94_09655 [Alphaproteobacteria bacterium]|nr:hypothetical protein [Alphaproteobacteria bacterium]HRX22411.1 hypothetical protein [Syntrophomonadaceae bacterium]